ncbi:MAG: hypothetical protein EVA65_16510 [Oceanococcus sp.]|nr:MAG: hypothetical protein EVA65_16510 [Oceanococcus sp.]
MQMQSIVTVEGFSAFEGTVDGTHHNNLNIYVLEKIKGSQTTQTGGNRTVEYKIKGNGSRYAAMLANKDFPMQVRIYGEMQSRLDNGKSVAEFVVDSLELIHETAAKKPAEKAA